MRVLFGSVVATQSVNSDVLKKVRRGQKRGGNGEMIIGIGRWSRGVAAKWVVAKLWLVAPNGGAALDEADV